MYLMHTYYQFSACQAYKVFYLSQHFYTWTNLHILGANTGYQLFWLNIYRWYHLIYTGNKWGNGIILKRSCWEIRVILTDPCNDLETNNKHWNQLLFFLFSIYMLKLFEVLGRSLGKIPCPPFFLLADTDLWLAWVWCSSSLLSPDE